HAARAPLAFDLSHFAAAYAHMLQTLVGLESLPLGLASLLRHGPSPVPLVVLGVSALGLARSAAPPADPPGSRDPRALMPWGCLWLLVFGVVIGPVADSWSAYYYTLAAVGGAVVVGNLLRRARPIVLAGVVTLGLWVHAGASATRAFAIVQRPWVWTSH